MLHLDLNHLLVSLIIGYVISCRISFNFNRNTRICGDIHCMLCVFVLFHVWLCGMILPVPSFLHVFNRRLSYFYKVISYILNVCCIVHRNY